MISDQASQRNDMVWFHGRLSRDQAYRLLIEAGKQDGLFLVRESTNAPGSFVLSLWNDHTAFHYQIRNHGHCRFSIDEGPLFPGLDTLVNYYRDQAGGLATKLVRCCVGRPPPPSTCQGPSITVELGRNLHRACETGDETEVSRLLQDPNINIEFMNEEGATSLHTACKKGHFRVVTILLDYNANVNSRDNEGRTPLMVGICLSFFIRFRLWHEAKYLCSRYQYTTKLPVENYNCTPPIFYVRTIIKNSWSLYGNVS